jgi:hypothetical protein
VTLTPQGNHSADPEDTVTVAVYDGGSGTDPGSLWYVWAPGTAAPGSDAGWRSFAAGWEALPLPQAGGDWYLHVKAGDLAGNVAEQVSSLFRAVPPPGSGGEGGKGGEGSEGGSGEEGGNSGEGGAPGQEEPSGQAPGGSQPTPGETGPAPGGSTPEAPAAAFTDLAGHWAEELVREMAGLGIIAGYPDGSLQPDRSITRAEFIAVVVRAWKAGDSNAEPAFADARGHWAEPAIAAAYELGWTGGLDAGRFGPDEPITREQMLVILMRALKASAGAGSTAAFADAGSISGWADAAIAAAVELGIAEGYPDGTIRPSVPATRAEALAVLARALKRLAQ